MKSMKRMRTMYSRSITSPNQLILVTKHGWIQVDTQTLFDFNGTGMKTGMHELISPTILSAMILLIILSRRRDVRGKE